MTAPPLPELSYLGDDVSYGYDAEDMRAFYELGRSDERERLLAELEAMHQQVGGAHNYYLCAAVALRGAKGASE